MKAWKAATVLMTSSALMLAACANGDDTNDAGEGPVEAKEVTVACTFFDDWCQALTQAFTDETGIAAGYVNMGTGEALTRIKASGDSPDFDVIIGGPSENHIVAKEEGLYEAYKVDSIPADYKDADGYWNGIYVGVFGFCSNQAVLDELGLDVPTSWDDLLDPRFEGQIGMAHPGTAGTAYNILWTQYVLHGEDEDATMDYMKALDKNISQYTAKGGASGPMAGRGELATAMIFAHDCPKWIDEGMTDLVPSFPEEGVGMEVGGIALIKGGPDRAAGEAFIDFATSAEAQEIAATVGSYQLPTNPDAKISEKSPDPTEVKLIDFDAKKAAAEKDRLVAIFEDQVEAPPAE